jgi:hypothetical protein
MRLGNFSGGVKGEGGERVRRAVNCMQAVRLMVCSIYAGKHDAWTNW